MSTERIAPHTIWQRLFGRHVRVPQSAEIFPMGSVRVLWRCAVCPARGVYWVDTSRDRDLTDEEKAVAWR